MFGRKREIGELLSTIREHYLALNEIVIASYYLKLCPNCTGSLFTILNVSETGHTVDYGCNNCETTITVEIMPNRNGMRAVEKLNQIKQLYTTRLL